MSRVTELVRYIQGERPGMRAGRLPGKLDKEVAAILYPNILLAPSIAIQTSVQLADISFWQGDVDFAKMKAARLAGVIIRAGQRNWQDRCFKVNWQKAREAGLPRGSYFFYDSREDPKKQAELWWSMIQIDTGELLHVADFEESYGGPFGKKEHFRLFLEHFQKISRLPDHRIAIYTGYFWWRQRIGDDPYYRRFGLWLAWYAPMDVVRVPQPWTEADLLFWQYTSSGTGTFYGVSSQEIDLNYYCCDLATFNKRFSVSSTEPPSTGDPTMDVIELRSTDITKYRTIRTAPTILAAAVPATPQMPAGSASVARTYDAGDYGYIYTEDVPDASMPTGYRAHKGDIWRRIFEMNGRPADGWMAEIHLGVRYLTPRIVPAPTPSPEPQPAEDIVITQTFSSTGYSVASSVVNGDTVTTTLKPK